MISNLTPTHIHLLLNHFPTIGFSIGIGLLIGALVSRFETLADRADNMGREMKFDFLYDEGHKLFAIGYNVTESHLDHSYYDLLASEARLASYIAVARGDVPQAHWFRMGRPITGRGPARCSST